MGKVIMFLLLSTTVVHAADHDNGIGGYTRNGSEISGSNDNGDSWSARFNPNRLTYAPGIFSWDYWTSPRSGIDANTPYAPNVSDGGVSSPSPFDNMGYNGSDVGPGGMLGGGV